MSQKREWFLWWAWNGSASVSLNKFPSEIRFVTFDTKSWINVITVFFPVVNWLFMNYKLQLSITK